MRIEQLKLSIHTPSKKLCDKQPVNCSKIRTTLTLNRWAQAK